jgi:hypothetical protein
LDPFTAPKSVVPSRYGHFVSPVYRQKQGEIDHDGSAGLYLGIKQLFENLAC